MGKKDDGDGADLLIRVGEGRALFKVVPATEDEVGFRVEGGAHLPQAAVTAGTFETVLMPVFVQGLEQVPASYTRRWYSPSSLSNTIVLRNEEFFPGRSVLGSSRLHRSRCSKRLLEMALKRAVD
ncbi:hypothetical protein EYF80_003098 [Liparis tanakae]|uniref:Uncharacterized protein n=1 Tax=Liparis tanakae TaxID=230148 RepID=A0A4Z2J949_9TELE|nr:hypothetical protein EYF80_003098 [Liparis tanakae]